MLNRDIIRPAYGRRYTHEDEVLADWNNGRDFTLWPHCCYCSIRDYSKTKGFLDRPIYDYNGLTVELPHR